MAKKRPLTSEQEGQLGLAIEHLLKDRYGVSVPFVVVVPSEDDLHILTSLGPEHILPVLLAAVDAVVAQRSVPTTAVHVTEDGKVHEMDPTTLVRNPSKKDH